MTMHVETFDIEIRSTEVLAPSVKSFVFSRVDGKQLVYQPGQWVNLVLPAPGGEIRRAETTLAEIIARATAGGELPCPALCPIGR